MRHILIAILLLIEATIPALGQRITRKEADSLALSLKKGGEDKARLFALLQLADFNIAKKGEEKADLDSAADLIARAKEVNVGLRSKEGEGYIVLEASYLDKERGQKGPGRALAARAITILEGEKNPLLLARAYEALAGFDDYRIPGELSEKIKLMEKADSCLALTDNGELQGYGLMSLADLYTIEGDNAKALVAGMHSLEKYKSAHYPNLQGTYILLSRAYNSVGNYDLAVAYGLKALKSAEDTHDSTMQLCQIQNGIGMTYSDAHERELAIPYFKGAMAVAVKYKDTGSLYVVAINMLTAISILDRWQQALHIADSLTRNYPDLQSDVIRYRMASLYVICYSRLGMPGKAEESCQQMLSYANLPTLNANDNFYIYKEALRYYLFSRQPAKALALYPRFSAVMEKLRDSVHLRFGYLMAYKMDSIRRDYLAAIDNLLHYNQISDSLFSAGKTRQIQQLQVVYETSEKEKDIQLLHEQGEWQKRELGQSRETRNFSIAGAGLLAMLLGLGFSRYRLKQRKNNQLEAKQKEITAKNAQLEKLLGENEWLLREVHHRVKNNLQVVMSLLNSQSAYLQDEKALNAVLESQHRVQAMSLIHQKLYKSSDVSSIYMPEYVHELVDYLRDSFKDGDRVRFDLDIAAVNLDVVQAVPVGLILNEVITNAFKHAFPHGADDTILVRLLEEHDGELSLVIADNGSGFPADVDAIVNNSFGRLLIHGLVEDLDGSLTVDRSDGTAYCIHFRQTVPGKKNEVVV